MFVSDECTCPACVGLPMVASPPIAVKDEKIVIAFTGKAGAGKSTAADHLIAEHGFARIKFARALKEMLRTFLRYRGVNEVTIERMVEGDLKEVPSPHLNGRTPRYAMVTLGTEWGRDLIHPDLWVDTERDHLPSEGRFVCDDCRFPNEREMIKSVGGSVVQVVRAGLVEGTHESEMHQLAADYVLINTGTIADLKGDLSEFLLSRF